ncbi:hypothetical protein VNI00_003668 [Paramarasmius palmivorus]|uniref:Uncharacterized protein n=1 Tax=Paramarasmius palmivorus TaxID=297713 RepID=A0AAW0DSY2_9AGAR
MASQHDPAALQKSANVFLDRTDSALSRAVTGHAHLKQWTCNERVLSRIPPGPVRSFIESLRIPACFRDGHRPNFLLGELGDAYEIPERQERYMNIFHRLRHSLVVNVSGSGKTRTVLEALSQIWGLYFLCAKEENSLGSHDLTHALHNVLPHAPGFTANIRDRHDMAQRLEDNRRIARLVLGEVLLARLLIFQRFIDKVESHMRSQHIPLAHPHFGPFIERWLHLQLDPSMLSPFHEGDLFADLVDTIHAVQPTPEEVHLMIFDTSNTLFNRLKSSFHGHHGGDVFIVLDEAQDAALSLYPAFRSQIRPDYARPVLRELIVVWSAQLAYPALGNSRIVDLPVTMVVSGTGMSVHHMREALLSSTVMKDGVCQEYNQIGGFEDKQSQLEYIRKYIPQEVLDDPVGKVLLDRMWYWLRGRYRFTAEFLAFLIQNGYKRPNELLNRYIANFTALYPTDCPENIMKMEEDPNSLLFGPFAAHPSLTNIPLQWENLLTQASGKLVLPTIRNLTWKWMVTSGLHHFLGGVEGELIQYGFARIPRIRVQGSNQLTNRNEFAATIDEPLVLWACAVWLNNTLSLGRSVDLPLRRSGLAPNDHTLYAHIADNFELNEGGHSWFEDFLMFYFCLAFSNPTEEHTLGDIFHIMGPHASALRRKKARLVSLYMPEQESGRSRAESSIRLLFDSNGQFLSCGATLGTRVGHNTGIKTQDWLANHDQAAFCFPDKAMGPDIIFVLELVDDPPTYIWVMVQAKRCGNRKHLPRNTLRDAIRSVTPWCYFMDKTVRKKFAAGKTQLADFKDTAHKNQVRASQETLKLLDELPGRETTLAGKHSVLRVVASYSAISCQWKHFNKPRPHSESLQDDEGDTGMQSEDTDDDGDEDEDDGEDASPEQTSEVDPDGDKHPLATLNLKKLVKLTESIPPDHLLTSWKASQIRARLENENAKKRYANFVGKKPQETKKRAGSTSAGAKVKNDKVQKPKAAASNPVRRSTRIRKSRC